VTRVGGCGHSAMSAKLQPDPSLVLGGGVVGAMSVATSVPRGTGSCRSPPQSRHHHERGTRGQNLY
jgi:hypothetical protein